MQSFTGISSGDRSETDFNKPFTLFLCFEQEDYYALACFSFFIKPSILAATHIETTA